MGDSAQQPPKKPIGATCSIIKTADGGFDIVGESNLLQEFFETKPEQWLRCLALRDESKNGKTKK